MIRIQQLSGGGIRRDAPVWIETLWFGVRLSTEAVSAGRTARREHALGVLGG
jgi:hypothetical protein